MSEDEFARAVYPLLRPVARRLSRAVWRRIPADDLIQIGVIGAVQLYRRDRDLTLRRYVTAARCDMIDHIRADLQRGRRNERPFSLKNDDSLSVSHERRYEARINREIDGRKAIELLQLGPHADITLRWLKGESLASIARDVGVHETAIHQRKTQAIRLVSDQLAG